MVQSMLINYDNTNNNYFNTHLQSWLINSNRYQLDKATLIELVQLLAFISHSCT